MVCVELSTSGTGVGMLVVVAGGRNLACSFHVCCPVLSCHPRHPVSPALFPMNYLAALYRTCA